MNDVLDVEARAVQGADDQVLFREVNERIRALLADPRRADAAPFLVAPGDDHVVADVEDVAGRRGAYRVVEKSDTARAVAEELVNGI